MGQRHRRTERYGRQPAAPLNEGPSHGDFLSQLDSEDDISHLNLPMPVSSHINDVYSDDDLPVALPLSSRSSTTYSSFTQIERREQRLENLEVVRVCEERLLQLERALQPISGKRAAMNAIATLWQRPLCSSVSVVTSVRDSPCFSQVSKCSTISLEVFVECAIPLL